MAVEECHDPQDDCRFSPRTIVLGTVHIGTLSQSRAAGSRQISTNDLQRDMCRALWLSRTRIPALCLARLWQTLRPSEPEVILVLAGLQVWDMRAFLIACVAALFIAVAAAYLLERLQETSSKSFSTPAVRL